jgi:hypothetical protein
MVPELAFLICFAIQTAIRSPLIKSLWLWRDCERAKIKDKFSYIKA